MVSHRRGGTHRVRDEDRTDSVYDAFNHKQLVAATKARRIYRKDMKKVEMVKALIADDLEKQRTEKVARKRLLDAQLEARKEDARKAAERQKLSIAKQKELDEVQRSGGVVMTDSSKLPGTAVEEQHEPGNVKMEAESGINDDMFSDASSDTTESSSASVDSPRIPVRKLRLFEWQHTRMPESSPLFAPPGVFPGLQPREVSYAPHKVLLTKTKQKLYLPGRWYRSDTDTDYVPELSHQTKEAARNGVLLHELDRAVIERAAEWAERTVIQYWSGLMYFDVPPPNCEMDLGLVYSDWHKEEIKLRRSSRRHTSQYRNQRRKIARDKATDIYEANRHRPTTLGYAPSYLDHDRGSRDMFRDVLQPLRYQDNLFYIRFEDCQVPHYYFWRRDGDWPDPTTPNPLWRPFKSTPDDVQWQPHPANQIEERRRPPARRAIRVKKTRIPENPLPKWHRKDRVELFAAAIERQLYWYGLARTLAHHKRILIKQGKSDAWKYFTRVLSKKYPSGKLPNEPPVDSYAGVNVATKIAKMHCMQRRRRGTMPTSPLVGDEAWTRDDDAFWNVVEVEDTEWIATIKTSHDSHLEPLADSQKVSAVEIEGKSLVNSEEHSSLNVEESSSGESEDSFFSSESEDSSSSWPGYGDSSPVKYEYSDDSDTDLSCDVSNKSTSSTFKSGASPAEAGPSTNSYQAPVAESDQKSAVKSDHESLGGFEEAFMTTLDQQEQSNKGALSESCQVPTANSDHGSSDGFEEAFMSVFEEQEQFNQGTSTTEYGASAEAGSAIESCDVPTSNSDHESSDGFEEAFMAAFEEQG